MAEHRHTLRRQRDKQLIQHEVELAAAARISEQIFQCVSLEELLRQILMTALSVVGAEGGSVLLADFDTQELIFRHSVGTKPVPDGTAISWTKGLVGVTFQTAQPLIIPNVKSDPRHMVEIDSISGLHTRDMICVPLKRWRDSPIGVLTVVNKRNGVLGQADLDIVLLVAGFAAIAIDQVRLYEEAKLADVFRKLGDLSHDVKNLLTPIISGTDLLDEYLKEMASKPPSASGQFDRVTARSHEQLACLKRAAMRLRRNMQEIADCAKGIRVPSQFAQCQLADIVESVLGILRPSAHQKGVELQTKGFSELPSVMADEHRLFHALYNVINNALDETPRGGSVTVEVQDCGAPDVLICITDTGPGMPRHVLRNLFKAKAASSKPGGTGLGTKIVKDIIEAHKGTVWADSEETKGTAIYFRLPRDPMGPSADVQSSVSILLVEDDVDIRIGMRHRLEAQGYQVREAWTGQKALALLREMRSDLIILDIGLPDMSGLEVLRVLREELKAEAPPVMILTGQDETNLGFQEQSGTTILMKKPFTGSTLIETVRYALGKSLAL
jgi:signal transduction histidine kinase/CheY-like chemotaxis protein